MMPFVLPIWPGPETLTVSGIKSRVLPVVTCIPLFTPIVREMFSRFCARIELQNRSAKRSIFFIYGVIEAAAPAGLISKADR